MKEFYNRTIQDVAGEFSTDASRGLSSQEIASRIEKYGKNTLVQKKNKSFFVMFVSQFKSFMIILLIIAAIISGVMGVKTGEGLLDTYVIMGILLLNAIIGAYQEYQAQKSLESLKKMAAPAAKVVRDGESMIVNVEDVVPGDLVELEVGDIVPADIRITEAHNMSIQESSMTGESVPVEKHPDVLENEDIPLGDRKNMAYSSGVVTFGHGRGIVVGTGMDTEIGKIADMLGGDSDTQTPMQVRLEKLGKVIGTASVVICVVIFLIGLAYGRELISMLMVAVSLAVAAIPEGLPAISTIILSMGVKRMVKHNAIIRKLPSVETLGCTTVICSDKTGTLTKNQMTVVDQYTPSGSLDRLIEIAVLCCDAKEVKNAEGGVTKVGDPTEIALIDLGDRNGVVKQQLDAECPREGEVPFDSTRKRMTTINRMKDGKLQANVKGGLDEVLSVCTRIETADGVRKITDADIADLQKRNSQMADSALRVLSMAYRPIDEVSSEVDVVERDLIFAGITGMIDPEREEVIGAISECHEAGIRTVMITGDHKATALAIASKIGLYNDGDLAITGTELEKLDDAEFEKNVDRYSVYARIAPEQKMKIVSAWQKRGDIVAMTGDGVNDAPALNFANVGLSMGSGTSVAKDASDITLLDDSFASIATAVMWGRSLYRNIQRFVLFQLTINFAAIVICFVGAIFGTDMPLTVVQILWVNIIMDTFAAMAMASLPPNPEVMRDRPRPRNEFIITPAMARTLFTCGGVMVVVLLGMLFYWSFGSGEMTVRELTLFFSTFVFMQFWNMFNAKGFETRHSVFKDWHGCREFFLILLVIAVGQVLIVEFGGAVFRTVPLSWGEWAAVIGSTSLIAIGGEVVRTRRRRAR